MNLYTDEHLRFLKSLQDHQVRFIIIGGHAAIYYGVNRNTGDIDILIEPTAENGIRLIKALKENGLDVPETAPEEFEKEIVLSFGREPDAVDIMNFTPGIEFGPAYANSVIVDIDGLKIRIIDIHDLIRNKENLQRKGEKSLLDKYDAEVLKKILKRDKES